MRYEKGEFILTIQVFHLFLGCVVMLFHVQFHFKGKNEQHCTSKKAMKDILPVSINSALRHVRNKEQKQ